MSRLRPDGCAATCRRRILILGGWRTRSTREKPLRTTSTAAHNPGGLSENNYANIVAYILQFNGVPAGTTPRT